LNLYLKHNFTGPSPHKWDPESVAPLLAHTPELASSIPTKRTLELLSVDGEDAYSLTRAPLLLLIALGIFQALEDNVADLPRETLPSLPWWKARALLAQQKTLENQSATIYESILECLEKTEAALDLLGTESELRPYFYLEHGIVFHYHKQDPKAKVIWFCVSQRQDTR
jgi:hypothetical protein